MVKTVLLAGVLILTCGCPSSDKQQAKSIVDAGTSTTKQLADYYTSLARDTHEWLILYSLDQDRTGTVVRDRTRKDFQQAEDALRARAAMAQKLESVYADLGKLLDYDASAETQTAVGNLLGAIKAAPKTLTSPLGGGVSSDSTKVLGEAAGVVTGWIQMREFRKSAPEAVEVLALTKRLFDSEKGVYSSIEDEYDKQTRVTARFIIQDSVPTEGIESLQKVEALYGFQIQPDHYCGPNMPAAECQQLMEDTHTLKQWLLNLVDQKEAALEVAAKTDPEKMSKDLGGVVRLSDKLLKSGKGANYQGFSTTP